MKRKLFQGRRVPEMGLSTTPKVEMPSGDLTDTSVLAALSQACTHGDVWDFGDYTFRLHVHDSSELPLAYGILKRLGLDEKTRLLAQIVGMESTGKLEADYYVDCVLEELDGCWVVSQAWWMKP
jgi:hypothetical protein